MSERAPRTSKLQYNNPAQTILASSTANVGEAPETGVVSSVSYTPNAAVTGADSPASRSLILLNRGQAGSGTTEVGRLNLVSGVNLTADNETEFTLSVVADATDVTAGDILEFQTTAVGGTGLVDPGGLVQVEISRS
jgi:hypothetical protein